MITPPPTTWTRSSLTVLLALVVTLATGCGALRPASVPIRTVVVAGEGTGRCLAVLLPGRYAAPEGFANGGFGESVRSRGLDLDVVAVDAHLGYYRTRTVVERVREDVVLPARAKGYEQIWLVGTSLGGLGTLLYLRDHPDDVTGALAIAPFLGDEDVIDEIERAGGIASWTPPSQIDENDIGRNLWRWLASDGVVDRLPLSLGWGMGDRFDRSNRLLASVLPANRVHAVEGAHDMDTWNRVWVRFLDETRPCGAAGAD